MVAPPPGHVVGRLKSDGGRVNLYPLLLYILLRARLRRVQRSTSDNVSRAARVVRSLFGGELRAALNQEHDIRCHESSDHGGRA